MASMNPILIAQIVISILLIVLILPQGQGGGLGATFGSSSYHTRRGIEKGIFRLTIIVSIIFVGLSIATLF
jgi:preprotein translocase subunit SecG